eukprot:5012399-Prymnesium_polylepis.1
MKGVRNECKKGVQEGSASKRRVFPPPGPTRVHPLPPSTFTRLVRLSRTFCACAAFSWSSLSAM